MKRFTFAIALVLMLVGSALAQKPGPPEPLNLWEGFSLSISKLDGVEVSTGTLDYVDSMCWGRSFSMIGEGASLTIAPNYYYDQKAPTDGGEYYSKITGGSFTIISNAEKANGMLFGELTGGTIEFYFDKSGVLLYAEITGDLNIKGGTADFAKVGGPQTYGKFTGTVHFDVRGAPRIVGNVDLNF